MKRYRILALVILIFSVSAVVEAQDAAGKATSEKVVTIAFNVAVLGTAEAQRELGALQAKYAPRQAQLQKLNDEVEALRKQLTSTTEKPADEERMAREQSLNSKEKQIQREAEDFRNDSEAASQQVFQQVAQKVYSFVQAYAREHGYSLVVERGSDANPIVWYAAVDLDITEPVVKAYNAKTGAGQPSALPAAPSPR